MAQELLDGPVAIRRGGSGDGRRDAAYGRRAGGADPGRGVAPGGGPRRSGTGDGNCALCPRVGLEPPEPAQTYVARVLQQAGVATLPLDLLTEDEAVDRLVFDIHLLAQRLRTATEWLHAQAHRITCASVISARRPARRQRWRRQRSGSGHRRGSRRRAAGPGRAYPAAGDRADPAHRR